MIRTILVPLDGSQLAERALPLATVIATAARARLVVFHVAPSVSWRLRPEPGPETVEQLNRVAQTAQVEGIAADVAIHLGEFGEAGSVIARAAREQGADLIVMATHGRGGFGRWLYGSNADQVLRRALTPVILVPAASQPAWPGDRPPRLLVPLDGSELAKQVLGLVGELAGLLEAELVLCQVVEPPVAPTSYPEPALNQAREYLEDLAEPLRSVGRPVETCAVVGLAVPTIASLAENERADLIVMSTHGRGGVRRAVQGSVATGTLQRASVPILLARPAALADLRERQVSRPAVRIELSRHELDLMHGGVEALVARAREDPARAEAARALLARLRQTGPEPSAGTVERT